MSDAEKLLAGGRIRSVSAVVISDVELAVAAKLIAQIKGQSKGLNRLRMKLERSQAELRIAAHAVENANKGWDFARRELRVQWGMIESLRQQIKALGEEPCV